MRPGENQLAAGVVFRAIRGKRGCDGDNPAVLHANIDRWVARSGVSKPGVSNNEVQCHFVSYSTFIPASRAMPAQRCNSAAMWAFDCAGVVVTTSTASSAMRSRTDG